MTHKGDGMFAKLCKEELYLTTSASRGKLVNLGEVIRINIKNKNTLEININILKIS